MRTITAVFAATAAVAFSACGAGDDAGSAAIAPQAAKAGVEHSAQLQLRPQAVPAEAREQGLESVYSNAATAAKDRAAQVERAVKAL